MSETFLKRRFLAALALVGKTVEEVASQAGVTSRMVWYVLSGERTASVEIASAMRSSVGESAWLFVTGKCDALVDKEPNL